MLKLPSLIANLDKQIFIDYYSNHTLVQTSKYFNLSESMTCKIIKYFEITKGKGNGKKDNNWAWYTDGINNKQFKESDIIPEGYIKGRIQNKTWRTNNSIAHKGKKQSVETIEKKRIKSLNNKSHTGQICLSKNGNVIYVKKEYAYKYIQEGYVQGNCKTKNIAKTQEFKYNLKLYHKNHPEEKKLAIKKRALTKKKNNSFTVSIPEKEFYIYLLKFFNKEDVIIQYRDDRYPFNCDFYIKPYDLFIELNLHWTHGGHLFDKSSKQDLDKIAIWKSKNSRYYNNAIYTWSDLDIRKNEFIKKNNLNCTVIYNLEELEAWKKTLLNH